MEKFSKKQWQMNQQRRCKQCIAENKEIVERLEMKPQSTVAGDACANCSRYGDDMKKCSGCLEVKYCSRDCQMAHRPSHKKACKKRAAMILEEKLFRDPPPREECPICFLELPFEDDQTTYQSCCGKLLCLGCTLADSSKSCAFCRTPTLKNRGRQANERRNKRIEQNDVHAIRDLACAYELGEDGLQRDEAKAFELFTRAAKLGVAEAHNNLGNSYKNGRGVAINMKKAKHHYQLGAIGGDAIARHNLGACEAVSGNFPVAMRHFMISAIAGWEKSMQGVRMGYEQGHISKDDFKKTMVAHTNAVNEMKSEHRDLAAALLH